MEQNCETQRIEEGEDAENPWIKIQNKYKSATSNIPHTTHLEKGKRSRMGTAGQKWSTEQEWEQLREQLTTRNILQEIFPNLTRKHKKRN